MTYPKILATPTVEMVITGRRVRDDGTAGCLIGYPSRDPVRELARLHALDTWEPRFSKAVMDRDYGLEPR